MGITTVGLSVVAANMTGSALPYSIAVGTSGLTYASGNTVLGIEFDRNQIDTKDVATAEQVTFVANWSPNDISGCILREFGCFTLGSQMLSRETLTGSLVFDGGQELQIQETILFKI